MSLTQLFPPPVFIDKPADVTVVETDGVQFAVLYECQSLWVLRRASAVILSRHPSLDEAVLQRVRCCWLQSYTFVHSWSIISLKFTVYPQS